MRVLHICSTIGAIVALLLAGCSSKKVVPAEVKIWADANRQIHIAAPGGGVSHGSDGRAQFSISNEENFDLNGESITARGQTLDMSLVIDSKRPVQLEISRLAEVNVQLDGKAMEPNVEIAPGKYKIVITAKLSRQ